MSALAITAIVIAASLLIGAVIYGLVRNNRAPGTATSGSNADTTSRRR